MRKKVMRLLLAVSMVGVLLTGCNEKAVESEKKPAQTTSVSVTKKEAAKTAEADTKSEKEKKQDSDKKTEGKKEAATASDSKKSQTTTKGNQGAAASNNSSTQTASKPASGTGNTTTQKLSGGNTGSGNPSAPTPVPTPEPQKPSHVHNWVEQFHNVHHEATGHNEQYVVTEAWDELVSEPIYEMVEKSICNVCSEDITGKTTAHTKAHALAGEGGGYHSEWQQIQIGTNSYTVHHDAVYGTRWVQDSATWDEQVSDGYRCSGCGATK